jgi:hypothetical protein
MRYSKNNNLFKEKCIQEKKSHTSYQTTYTNNSFKIIACQK